MGMSDELIARYVERAVTAEERDFVRKYLCEHPEEYERVLCLMDNDTVDYLGEQLEISDECIPMSKASFSDIAYSAAAFAPVQNKQLIPKPRTQLSKTKGLRNRLSRMSDELDDII